MDRSVATLVELGDSRQRLNAQWVARRGEAMLAILDGNFQAAEKLAQGAGTLRRRSGQSRGWRQSGAWTGRRPTAAARRGSCAWVIPVGPSPLLSKKERSPADSRITQRRSSRPSTALLPWSPSTGTGGRHPPETVVPSNRKPWSPWTGARSHGDRIAQKKREAASRRPLSY